MGYVSRGGKGPFSVGGICPTLALVIFADGLSLAVVVFADGLSVPGLGGS